MVIDTSVVVALLRGEPEARVFAQAIQEADSVKISAVSVLEAVMVLGAENSAAVDLLLSTAGIQIVELDEACLRAAVAGFRSFGRRSGSAARLNFGDCCTYGTAVALHEPLLFQGQDFSHTDVRCALADG